MGCRAPGPGYCGGCGAYIEDNWDGVAKPPGYAPGDHEIELASGGYLNLVAPEPHDITIDDIAHGLANTCRYAGHTKRFYSVAEHAVLVADRLRVMGATYKVQLAGLHHDDAEAFVADIARPLKTLLQPAYDEISDRLDAAISKALDLPIVVKDQHQIKDADNWALAAEAHHLLPSKGVGWWSVGLYHPGQQPQWVDGLGLSPASARNLFLHAHEHLLGVIERESARAA